MATASVLTPPRARRFSLASLLAGMTALVGVSAASWLVLRLTARMGETLTEADLARMPGLFAGLVVAFLAGLAACLTGILALGCTRQEGRTPRCGRMAAAGIALGLLAVLAYLFVAGLVSSHLPPPVPILSIH